MRLPPLTAAQRRALLAMRHWTSAERAVVARGLLGRVAIALEPGVIALLFGIFTVGLLRLAYDGDTDHAGLQLLAPIFGLGALAFSAYAVYLVVRPAQALRQTFEPIFIVDGFVRTRGRDDLSARGSSGYVAVLLSDRRVACEWPATGERDLPYDERPALCEFSEYGGIHSIDGKATGVLPQRMPNIGVGVNRPPFSP